MKTAYIINSLEGGGAERVFVELIKQLSMDTSKQELPEVILLDKLKEVYDLPTEVNVIRIGSRGGFVGFVFQLVELNRLLRKLKPDLTVSFLTRANIMNVCVAKLHGWSSVISERSNTRARLSNRFARLKLWIVGFFYRRADLVIAVSQGVSDCLVGELNVSQGKVGVLNNPVDIDWLNHRAKDDSAGEPGCFPSHGVVAMGRLVRSKGFEDLIKAYKMSGLTCGLTILGDGPERQRLGALVGELELNDQVDFLGFVKNPHQVINQAEQFVLCSHLEGFPNALLEAMALGKPIVTTNCTDGPTEILSYTGRVKLNEFTPTDYGLLVNVGDQQALAKAMLCLHEDEVLRVKLANKAKERMRDYSKDSFYRNYLKLIARITRGQNTHV